MENSVVNAVEFVLEMNDIYDLFSNTTLSKKVMVHQVKTIFLSKQLIIYVCEGAWMH